MSTTTTVAAGAGWRRAAGDHRLALAVFTGTIFLSALLLFSVQPMFARMVLPKLGGSPSVWAVSMCFFQAVLLAGYCWAHALDRFLKPVHALGVHVVMLALACLALPIALPAGASDPPSGDAYFWLIGMLAAGVGIPFFAVSANAPLLQSWYARSGEGEARDPYFLYAASNAGSLIALLAYPLVVEPLLGLRPQATTWTVGFMLLAVMIAACGVLMLASGGGARMARAASEAGADAQAAAPARPLAWIGLAFVPSALLVAFTTYVTTDIASAPFLWVLPLALFLGTFIVTFRDRPLIPHAALLDRQAILVALALIMITGTTLVGSWLAGISALVAFIVTALIAHRELYERRPAPAQLTQFYLLMSLGGVLGGVFAALVAPQLFNSTFEFPLLIVMGLLCRPEVIERRWGAGNWREPLTIVAAGLLMLVTLDGLQRIGIGSMGYAQRVMLICALACALWLTRQSYRSTIALLLVILVATVYPVDIRTAKHQVRSFFGVHRVVETDEGQKRVLVHGITVHGVERIRDKDGHDIQWPPPASYYHVDGPMAKGLRLVRQAQIGIPSTSVGVIGLGAGAMACNAVPGELWKFYEIDPAVVDIARDPSLFRFMSKCQPGADIILGDARLTVAREPARSFDYLLVDAFSSDAIPVHLLTVEAIQLYLDKLSARGVLAIHISNRHLDLQRVVAANVQAIPGLSALLIESRPKRSESPDALNSNVVLISRDRAMLEPALAWQGAKRLYAGSVRAWTDDYSDIVSALIRRHVAKALGKED
jgi:hypothetical protein